MIKIRRPWPLLLLAAALLAAATACSPAATQSATPGSGERLRVVATTSLVGDVVARVGGDRIALTTLIPNGVDPHTFVPRPADVAAIHDAHVLFANGAGLEEFLAEMLSTAGGQTAQVDLSGAAGVKLRALDESPALPAAGEAHGDEGGMDPHVWFDVQNVLGWVEVVESTLSTLDPANAAVYRANAAAYRQELADLDAWIVQQTARVPAENRKLVINHPVLGYFADRYGFEQIGAVYPLNPSAEPSAQDLAALEESIRQFGVPAVFAENTVSARLAEQVSRDTGVRLVLLYTDALGGEGSGVQTYIELMRYDVTAIVEALE